MAALLAIVGFFVVPLFVPRAGGVADVFKVRDSEQTGRLLKSESHGDRQLGLMDLFYRAHSLSAADMRVLLDFVCTSDLSDKDDQGVAVRICAGGGDILESLVVTRLADSLSRPVAECGCSPVGLAVLARALIQIDADYKPSLGNLADGTDAVVARPDGNAVKRIWDSRRAGK